MSSSLHIRRSMHSANAVVNKLRPSPACFSIPGFLLPSQGKIGARRLSSRHRVASLPEHISAEQLRGSFVDALVQAGGHRQHSGKPLASRTVRRSSEVALKPHERKGELRSESEGRLASKYTADEYLSLVDFYDDYQAESPPKAKDPLSWSEGELPPEDLDGYDEDGIYKALETLDKFLTATDSSPEDVYKAYRDLPAPGVKFLEKWQRIYLIRKLSVTEYKSSARTMAYLSLLDDYRKVGLPIPRHAWNSAIALGSTTLSQITDAEVEFAVRTWKEMEFQAGIRGDEATFNILFDVASKAGKFSLAEMILQEMDSRGLKFNRFTHVGLILHFGLRKDGASVRKSYRDMVAAKEVIDTVVLNCVISALMTAGEPEAARAVFERMKTMAREREGAVVGFVPRTWAKRRELSRVLKEIAKQARGAEKRSHGKDGHPDTQTIFRGMQDMISIAPDTRTCAILVRHYATAAHLRGCAEILETMQQFNIGHSERIFADLFRGFATHGPVTYSGWSSQRLLDTWDACTGLLENGPLVFGDRSRLMGIWALIAIRRNLGYDAAMEAYEVLRGAWKGEDDFEAMIQRPFAPDNNQLDFPKDAWEVLDDLRIEDGQSGPSDPQ